MSGACLLPVVFTLLLAQDPGTPTLDSKRLDRVRSALLGPKVCVGHGLDEESAYDDLAASHDPSYPDPSDVPYLIALIDEADGADAELVRVRALQAARPFPIVDEDQKRLISILARILPEVPDKPDAAKARYPLALCREVAQVTQPAVREATHTRVLATFTALAKCSDAGVRAGCAKALGRWNEADALPLLAGLLADADPDVLRKTVLALESYDASSVADRLRALMKETRDADTRISAACSLARCGQKDALEVLFLALKDTDAGRRGAVRQRLQDLVCQPLLKGSGGDFDGAWMRWWMENGAKVRWDADRKVFVVE